jgi:hypothetical protein
MLDNALQMNDEDFMRAMESHEDQVQTETIEDTQVINHDNNETDTTQENDGSNADTEVIVDSDDMNQPSQEVDENNPNSDTVTEDTHTSNEQQETETTEIDYKKFYETVTQDFKASGKVIPGVKEPEKFIKALQMATDYALKTAALKPALKRVKMLDGITDEEFTEMLDFRKRNPEVLKKALKEAQLDPLDLDLEDIQYTPQSKIMSDADYEFKETIEKLSQEDTVAFQRTQNIVLNELDSSSKTTVLSNPHILAALQSEVASGRFEKIQAQALQLKAFGGYNNVPDIELYSMIANEMDKQAMASNPVQSGGMNPQVANTVQPNNVSKPNPELEDKRVRAGIQPKTSTPVVKKYDPTKLSDEEFMKLLEAGAEFIDR